MDQNGGEAGNGEEEEKKSHSSSSSQSDAGSNADTSIELTSNFAFDRFLSIGAFGYANGLIKIVKVSTVKDEVTLDECNRQKEKMIVEASDCEIVQLCFREGHA